MPPKLFLKNLTIPAPCSVNWNTMKGNDQVRFCEHCDLSVHNLSAMTRNQAERLVARSSGRLCVQYVADANGKPLLAQAGIKLHRISRRASRIAASAFTATLSVTSAVAHSSQSFQNAQSRHSARPTAQQPVSRFGVNSSLVGTVTDQNGAVISGATVSVSNAQSRLALYVSSDSEGYFKIDNLDAGVYSVRIEAPGFAPEEVGSVYVQARGDTRVSRALKVAAIEATVEVESGETHFYGGAVAIVAPEHPFVKAAHEDDLEGMTALISETDVNLRDSRTQTTALEHAVRNSNREMVQFLLSAGADPNARDASGQTVLMELDEDATADLVWDLINNGAKVNLQDEDGNTALMQLAGSKNVEAMKALIDGGAGLEIRNENGRTALMMAAAAGHVNTVRALIVAGADISAFDNEKKDALAHAIEENNKAVIRLLKSRGALENLTEKEKDEEEEEP